MSHPYRPFHDQAIEDPVFDGTITAISTRLLVTTGLDGNRAGSTCCCRKRRTGDGRPFNDLAAAEGFSRTAAMLLLADHRSWLTNCLLVEPAGLSNARGR